VLGWLSPLVRKDAFCRGRPCFLAGQTSCFPAGAKRLLFPFPRHETNNLLGEDELRDECNSVRTEQSSTDAWSSFRGDHPPSFNSAWRRSLCAGRFLWQNAVVIQPLTKHKEWKFF
jgi:hypothetical protein